MTVLRLLPLLFLMACARPPAALRGDYAPLTVAEALARPEVGARVRWGGELVETRPEADRTCFEIVDHPLDRMARPRRVDDSSGRFIACAPGFYDPEVWTAGREVTAVGTLAGDTDGKVGAMDYRFPRVDADGLYLWPPRDTWPPAGPSINIGIGVGF
jgi:outer membrane lipoprotein